MDPTEGNNLLDLHWENSAAGEKALQQQEPASEKAPEAASVATTAADASASGDFLVDDDWDTFQSALPNQGEAAAAAAAAAAAPADTQPSQAPAQTAAKGNSAADTAADDLDSFDPMSAAKEKDAFGVFDQAAPDGGKGTENLISLGKLDEFDPVAQTWAKEARAAAPAQQEAPPPETAAAAAAPSSSQGDLLGLGGSTAAPAAAAAAPQGVVVATEDVLELEIDDVADIDKKMVFVYHKGEKNCVGWYADCKPSDIKEAILCACDAIIDGGFVLREVQFEGEDESTAEPKEGGKVFNYEEFDQLANGETYIIEPAKERDDLKAITGDRWRRLKVQIEPLLHVEAVKAIDRMRRGSNLLKHTHYGFPHLRQFQLSDDRKRLIWYSGAKQKDDSVVQLDEVAEIRLGQTTPVFLHYRLPMLEHLSFSLVYGPKGSKTLDLTCKDEFEFDHWVTGLKAVLYHFKNRQISKEELLGHSKRFRKALEKSNCGIKLTKLPEVKEKGHVGLDDCIEIVTHTPAQLDTKMSKLRERLKAMSQQVARLDHHAQAEMEMDLSLLTGQGPAYASVFVQDEDAQDEEMEIRRMHELVEQTTQVLQQAQNELIALKENKSEPAASSGANSNDTAAKGKKKETAACKHIDQLLWKAEVDLENVEDMYLRHVDNQRETATPFSVSVADMNRRLTEKFEEVKGWFSR